MKYKIFYKNNEVKECETLEQCINCIAAMLNALGNDYARSDFKIYAKVDSGLDRIESLENLIDAYKLDIQTGKDIINELKAENAKLKAAIELLRYEIGFICLEDNGGNTVVEVLNTHFLLNKDKEEILKAVQDAEN